jgi:SAM-dependent methyltransferase
MGRARRFAILAGTVSAVAAGIALLGHGRGLAAGRRVPGGILMPDVARYDMHTSLLLGSFYAGIADDIASAAPDGARLLEVGCGPGHLSLRLASRKGFDVTGLDLDPDMVERATANADRPGNGRDRRLSFLVGDVASLPFPDDSFDLVVSTLSMHHWADPGAGMSEIARVLRPAGRALIWDLRPGVVPFHRHAPDPLDRAHGTNLRVASATAWRWPWRFAFTQRIELVRSDGVTEPVTRGHRRRATTSPGTG